ncbi:MAG: AbiV family abortive infection protein [Bacteroidetes bacterium]|nr:AbiV family abortive infection protein [Bacteroidota bacterium]
MASKPLQTLTQEECSKYFEFLQGNAAEQWKIADTLSTAEQYGAATSHLLISIEESIKSIIVFMDSQGYQFRSVKGIDTIFSNHRIRFFIAYFMFSIGIFGDDLIKWLKKVKQNPELIQEHMKLFVGQDDLPLPLKYYFLRKLALLKTEMIFFKNADLIRQIGFYVDYNEQVQSPQAMTKDTYKEIYQRMEKVKRFVKGLIDAYTPSDETMDKLIAKNKQLFNDEKYYKLIEDGLFKVKKTKSSPFDLLNENL